MFQTFNAQKQGRSKHKHWHLPTHLQAVHHSYGPSHSLDSNHNRAIVSSLTKATRVGLLSPANLKPVLLPTQLVPQGQGYCHLLNFSHIGKGYCHLLHSSLEGGAIMTVTCLTRATRAGLLLLLQPEPQGQGYCHLFDFSHKGRATVTCLTLATRPGLLSPAQL